MALLRVPIDGVKREEIERDLRFYRHVQRYRAIRRFCYGRVLDYGCGTGYGARIIGENPDVTEAVEFDPGEGFRGADAPLHRLPEGIFDVMVALEVIEHLDDPGDLASVAASKSRTAIVSFPDLPTKRFNEHHKHDLCRQDVVDLFVPPGFMPWHAFRLEDCQVLLFMRRPQGMPAHAVRNLLDLR